MLEKYSKNKEYRSVIAKKNLAVFTRMMPPENRSAMESSEGTGTPFKTLYSVPGKITGHHRGRRNERSEKYSGKKEYLLQR